MRAWAAKLWVQGLVFLFVPALTVSGAWGETGTIANADRGTVRQSRGLGAQLNAPLFGSHDLLQYGSSGHMMGFMPGKVYFASRDYALRIEFIGDSGSTPREIALEGSGGGSETKALKRMEYNNLWPGITLRYEKDDQGIAESTYIVQPGADTAKIRLKYNVPVILRADGGLTFGFRNGEMTESAPVAWQSIDGEKRTVAVAFAIKDSTVGFQVGPYDRAHPLIIDPTYQWHTFHGSSGDDRAFGIAADENGNVYVAGYSPTGWGGPAGQAPLNAFSGNSNNNIFVLKLDGAGIYQWHTFYGSESDDFARWIAVDADGNVYVTGWSLAGWNGPSGQAPLNAYYASDIFVLKLNGNGAYQWHAFFGGGGSDYAFGTAIDANGSVYLTGQSGSSWTGPAGQSPLHAYSSYAPNLFVLKISSNGVYQWHTFYGSGGTYEYANSIVTDEDGNVYVTGNGGSWTGPAGQAALHAYSGSNADAFVLKLNDAGTYQWHTFYGGKDDYNYGFSIAANGGYVYVGGCSNVSWNGPSSMPSGQAPLHAFSGYYSDLFVLKLSSGGAYQWHTFYGADGYDDSAHSLVIDNIGNIFLAGYSGAAWNGPTGQAPTNAFSGSGHFVTDIVLLKLDSSGAYQWHTFYGSGIGNGNGDMAYGLTVDESSNLYATGYSYTGWNTQAGAPPINAHSVGNDLVVVKLWAAAVVPAVSTAAVTDITTTTATGGGSIPFDGEAPITAKGVCWSTSPNPTLADSCTSGGMGTDAFTIPLYSLTRNTLYHIRAYATNAAGTGYGNDVDFTTAACTIGEITEYTVPTASSLPYDITAGPDGNLWFTELEGNKIGRITPEGVITEFPVPTAAAHLRYITSSPDGNLWFTESYAAKIGKITPEGVITEYRLPASAGMPWGITAGPDGNLWFTELNTGRIGRMTTTGAVVEFVIPTADSHPYTITNGPDGNLWFTESWGNTVGKITTDGVMTEYPLPATLWMPYAIAAGPDGNLWVTGEGSNIGRLTPSGVYTEYAAGSSAAMPGIAAGPDGNLWFTQSWGNKIGRITTSGVVTEFPVPTFNGFPQSIAAGPDGSLWFTEYQTGKIGKLSTCVVMIQKGDVNGDGVTDLADAIAAMKALTGMTMEGQTIQRSADVNTDGKIGLSEVIYILQKAAGLR